jgi:hypothetical protein
MAKKKKYPKQPKKSASLKVWENYQAKIKEIDKHNAKIDADEKKKEAMIGRVQKMKR